MYFITAIVGTDSVLRDVIRQDDRLSIVALDLAPFGIIPLTEEAMADLGDRWGVDLEDFAYSDPRYLAGVEGLLRGLCQGISNPTIAFIAAKYTSGSGTDFGCVLTAAKVTAFSNKGGKRANANISMALKAIGVPEKLEGADDAFEVLGLGRSRHVEGWLSGKN